MNKKGIEKIMTIWWFFIWVIIIVAVVVDVSIFANREIDYRNVDASILANKISTCITQEKIDLFQYSKEINLIKNCGFYDDTFNNGLHAVKITIFDKDGKIFKIGDKTEIIEGPTDMFKQCVIKENSIAKQYPECANKEILIKKSGVEYIVYIDAGSNLLGERVLNQNIKIENEI